MTDQSEPHRKVESTETRTGLALSLAQAGRPASDAGVDEVHISDFISDFLRVLYRRRWLATTIFLCVVLIAAVNSFTAISMYEATTKLLIESTPNVIGFTAVVEDNQNPLYYQTEFNILSSRSLTRKTLDAEQLWDHVAFVGEEGEEGEEVLDDENVAESRIVDAFLSHLTVTGIADTRIVDVTFRSADPRLAVQAVNGLARAYIEQNLTFKFEQSLGASDWLADRLEEQGQQVEDAELALQRYREENDAMSVEEQESRLAQTLAEVNAAIARAMIDRMGKEAVYNQLLAIQSDRGALETFPEIMMNGFIQQQKGELANLQRTQAELAETLGDRHPEMLEIRSAIQNTEARIEDEIARVVSSVHTQFLTAEAQEQDLVAALDLPRIEFDRARAEALAFNARGIESRVLEREVESLRTIYQSLLQRANETGVSGELRTSNVRIMDVAELPEVPVSPRRRLNLLLGILAGVMLAGGTAFFFEYFDNRIKHPDQIRTDLGLSFLGMIPLLSRKDQGATGPLIGSGVPVSFTEALSKIRSNLLFSSAEKRVRSVVITSARSGEGKSIIAVNLAVSLAQTGQHVLLIDADLHHPSVHLILGEDREPGLTNLLTGQAKVSEAVRQSVVKGLWVLTAGKTTPHASALLESGRYEEFHASLDERFDWVIIDSAPVLAVSDAAALVHLASGVIFVVGAEMTNRREARSALEQLESIGGWFYGAVLNRVDVEANPYYYTPYYRREYTEYSKSL